MSLTPLETRTLKAPEITAVDVDQVDEDPQNARLTFDEAELKILAASLKERQLYPIQVRRTKDGRYLLIDGARRLRAAKLAGLDRLRAEVWSDLDEQQAAVAAATANLEREDLTPYEEARAFQRLVDAKVPKKEICTTFGIPFNTLQSRLELLDLPETVAKRVGDARGTDGNVFGLGHAKALQPIAKHPKLLEAALKGFDELKELPSAREAEARVRDILYHAELIANPLNDLPYEARQDKDLAKKLAALPHVTLQQYGSKVDYVTDLAAADKLAAEWKAKHKAKAAKERAADTKAAAKAKVDPAAAQRQRRLEELAKPHVLRLRAEGVVANLKSAPKRHARAWASLAGYLNDSDALAGPGGKGALLAIAKGCKLDGDQVLATFHDYVVGDGEGSYELLDDEHAPAWFTKATPDQQLQLLVAFTDLGRVAFERRWAIGDDDHKQLVGATIAEVDRQALRLAKDEYDVEVKQKASAKKLAHEDKKPRKGGDAPPASAKKAAPAPKAKGKAKVAVKVTPAVAKAKAKLDKAKQAKLVVAAPLAVTERGRKTVEAIQGAMAESLPDGNGPPAASPREIADRVLADVLPSLRAVKTAAADNDVQA